MSAIAAKLPSAVADRRAERGAQPPL